MRAEGITVKFKAEKIYVKAQFSKINLAKLYQVD